jgi:hypothetical protein
MARFQDGLAWGATAIAHLLEEEEAAKACSDSKEAKKQRHKNSCPKA